MAIDLTQTSVFYPGFEAAWGMEQFWFGSQSNDIEVGRKAAKIKGDAFGARFTNSQTGIMDGSIKVKGVSAQDKGLINWQIDQWMGRKSAINAWAALQGVALGSPVLLSPVAIMDNSLTAKLADAVDFSLELDARGALDSGVILLSPQNVLTGSSGTGPADLNVGYGGVTSNGCVAHLHVLAIDGGTAPTVTVTISHGTDGVTYVPLITFAAQGVPTIGSPGSQRIKLSSTTTVNPYVQATWTTSGTPTDAQVMVGFSRGVNLNV
jgi:hypothetical protein